MKKTERIARVIIESSGAVGTIFLIPMVLITVADVSLRFLFKTPIMGSYEVSEQLMVCVVFLGIGLCGLRGGHVNVNIIDNLLKKSKIGQVFIHILGNALTMGFSLLIAIQSFSHALFLREMELKTVLLGIPRYPSLLIICFGYFLLFMASIIKVKELNFKNDIS